MKVETQKESKYPDLKQVAQNIINFIEQVPGHPTGHLWGIAYPKENLFI